MNKRKALEAAMSYVQMGKLDRAIAEYQAILKADPSDINVLNSLGDLCARTGNKAEAIAHFMRLGQVYAQDALNLRAIAVYKKVLKLDPSHIEASLACGDMYAEQGLMADAKLQLQRVADHFLQKGDRRKALEVYEKLIRVDPGHHATVQKIAQMLVKARGEEAVAQLVGLGKRLIGAGQGDDARQIHEKVVELLSSQGRAAEAARFTEGFRLVEAEARGGEVATAPSSGEEMAEVGMEEPPLEPSADIGEALAAEPGVLESTGDASLLMEGIGGEAQESVTLEEMLEAGVSGSGGVESGDETEPASITLDAFAGSGDLTAQSEQLSDSVTSAGSETLDEQVQEAEFLLQQGMVEEARAIFQSVLLRDSEHALAKRRLARIEQMAGAAQGEAAVVDEQKRGVTSAPSPPSEREPASRLKVAKAAGSEGDFVDLAGEISGEIERKLPADLEPEVQGVLRELERGIREQVDATDYETHYNLGIAYKDMELYDEALEQFRLAAKDPAYRVQSASLAGLCYLTLGQAERAVGELNQGLSATEGGTEERWAVLYDLATAYEALGDTMKAFEALQAIHEEAPRFRDVRVRVRDLRERLDASRGSAG